MAAWLRIPYIMYHVTRHIHSVSCACNVHDIKLNQPARNMQHDIGSEPTLRENMGIHRGGTPIVKVGN